MIIIYHWLIIVLWLHKSILSATFLPHDFLENFFTFKYHKTFQNDFSFLPSLELESVSSLRSPCSFIVESCLEIKIWALGVLISTTVTCISINSQWTKLRHICMHSYTHTYIHISVSINLSFKNHEITLIPIIQTQYHRVCHRLPSFLFFKFYFLN